MSQIHNDVYNALDLKVGREVSDVVSRVNQRRIFENKQEYASPTIWGRLNELVDYGYARVDQEGPEKEVTITQGFWEKIDNIVIGESTADEVRTVRTGPLLYFQVPGYDFPKGKREEKVENNGIVIDDLLNPDPV